MKKIKQRLREGEILTGCWLSLGNSVVSEIVGHAGFDWVLIDLEHGVGVEKDLLLQLQSLSDSSSASIVRIESSKLQRIMRVLDFGAEGIMCPRVKNVEDAKKVVSGVCYPPEGNRGVAKLVRATKFGENALNYFRDVKENILGIVQIETSEVLNYLDEIANLEGVDVLFIGPADLTMSLGIFGQLDHPLFIGALEKTIDAANKAGKSTGILLHDVNDFEKYRQMGIQMLACGADIAFIKNGAQKMANELNIRKNKFD